MWNIKVLSTGIKTAVANFFFLTNFIFYVIWRVTIMVYNLGLSFKYVKLTWTWVKIRNGILRVISMLMSANKKVFSKNWDSWSTWFTKKKAITMPKISSLLLSIFWVSTIFLWIQKPSFLTKLGCIALFLLPELIDILMKCWLKWIK